MTTLTLYDMRRQYYMDKLGLTGLAAKTIGDLEYAYFASVSGLTPKEKFSTADHMQAYYRLATGLTTGSIADLQNAMLTNVFGVPVVGSLSDRYWQFFTGYGGFSPNLVLDANSAVVPGPSLWLDASAPGVALTDATALATWSDRSSNARHATQATGTKQPLLRTTNKNITTYNQATTEVDVTPWNFINNCSGAQDAVLFRSGIKSLKVTSLAAGLVLAVSQTTAFIAVTSGQQLTLSGYIENVVGSNVSLRLTFYDSDKVTGATVNTGASVTSVAGSWTRASVTATVPASKFWARLDIQWTAVAASEILNVDDIQVEVGAAATAFALPVTLPNNKPVVQFDGIDDFLSSAFFGTPTSFTAYYVYRMDAFVAASSPRVIIQQVSLDGFAVSPTTTLNERGFVGNGAANISRTVTTLDHTTNTDLGVLKSNGTTLFVYANGATDVGTAAVMQATTSGTTSIGGVTAGGGFALTGTIACLLLFPTAHDDTTRKKIEQWLGHIYGITVAP